MESPTDMDAVRKRAEELAMNHGRSPQEEVTREDWEQARRELQNLRLPEPPSPKVISPDRSPPLDHLPGQKEDV